MNNELSASSRPGETREVAVLGGGCFWCLDAVFRELNGVIEVASGYSGGTSADPSYEEICTGRTGHAEVVKITFDPAVLSFRDLLTVFFTIHDPTTRDRQGNDVGTQYRSGIYWAGEEQHAAAERSRAMYQETLAGAGFGDITTEIAEAGPFFYAEEYHQQYLAKNPNGYCGLGGTGVSCPIGLGLS
jgi:peptide-methionine (S)-S-oxide reductase